MDACVGEDVQVLQHVTWCPLQIDGIHLQVEEELLFRLVQNQYTSLFLLELMVAVTASVFSVRTGAEVCHSATIAPGLSPSLRLLMKGFLSQAASLLAVKGIRCINMLTRVFV